MSAETKATYTKGPLIAAGEWVGMPPTDPSHVLGVLIAEFYSSHDNPHLPEAKAEAAANARLFVAAPDLLESLLWFVSDTLEDAPRAASFRMIARSHGFKRELDSAIAAARAAIQRALGEQS